MNCDQCETPLVHGTCAACEAEDRMFAAYVKNIAIPPMWNEVDARLRVDARPRRIGWMLTAAAMAGIVIAALIALHAPHGGSSEPSRAAGLAVARYRAAIARLEPRANSAVAALLPEMNTAIRTAERTAARAPDDPTAVTNLVAAYDAKLQMLRANIHDE